MKAQHLVPICGRSTEVFDMPNVKAAEALLVALHTELRFSPTTSLAVNVRMWQIVLQKSADDLNCLGKEGGDCRY